MFQVKYQGRVKSIYSVNTKDGGILYKANVVGEGVRFTCMIDKDMRIDGIPMNEDLNGELSGVLVLNGSPRRVFTKYKGEEYPSEALKLDNLYLQAVELVPAKAQAK